MTVLPDVLAPDLRIVFCGTAVSATSAQRRAYYARPGNRFSPTLFTIGLTPRQLRPDEYATIIQYGLGLTDLAKTVSGCDNVLEDGYFDRDALRAKVEHYGHKVAYRLLPETIGPTRLFVLPSTSGSARKHWSMKPWEDLAAL